MLLKFLKGRAYEEILHDVILYEYGFDSYEAFIQSSLTAREKEQIHIKTMRYTRTQCVDDKLLWVTARAKNRELEKELENLKNLLGSPDETNRVLGINLARNLFHYNREEIGFLMTLYYHSEINGNTQTWTLNGHNVISEETSEGIIVKFINKKGKEEILTKNGSIKDNQYVPRLLTNFFRNYGNS